MRQIVRLFSLSSLALSILAVPPLTRLVRANTIMYAQREFVVAARSIGAPNKRILFREILPNIVPTLLVLVSLQLGLAIVAEGSLSFLGLGVPAPAASWGGMLADGRKHLADGWWMAVMPGVALSITVLATNLFGDWLRDRLDPTLRGR